MEELIYRDRRGTNASKWNLLSPRFTREDLLGLWVADMDFAAPACVREALHKQVDFGVFGYDVTPEAYYEAFLHWEKTYHGYEPQRAWLRYSPGVVAGFNWLIQLLTKPGDGVLVQTPVYYPFLSAATDNGCRLVENELVNTAGVYTVDLADFERKLTEEHVKVFLLCSPHNPVGRVWRREELAAMLELCRAHGVYVISDEIHHDFTHGGHKHIPAATVGEYDDMLVTLTAPSKTFNLAGLKNSVVIIPDEKLRKAWDSYTGKLHTATGGSFGVIAAQAAWEKPDLILSPLEGTYLAWLDLGAYVKPQEMAAAVEGRCGLAVDYGAWFGGHAPCHIRINLATRPENIRQAIQSLADHL